MGILSLSLFFLLFFNPLPSIFHCVLVSLATSEVIAVARHALPVMAFRHSIKRVSAYRRRERRLSFIVEILIRSLSISFAAIRGAICRAMQPRT